MVPSAVLDACVLYPVGLRDTLLNVAEAGLFRVLWTDEILAETTRNIIEDTPGLTAEWRWLHFLDATGGLTDRDEKLNDLLKPFAVLRRARLRRQAAAGRSETDRV